MAPRTLMPSPDLMDSNASQSGQGTHSMDSNVAYTNEPTQLADAINLMQSAISQTGQGTPSMVSNMAYTSRPIQLSAPTTTMAALGAPVNTHPTHFMTLPRTLMPSPRFMDPTTHQTGQNTHFMASNRAYNSQPTQFADAIALMQSAISQTGQGTPPEAPSMAYTGQPTQWTAPGTLSQSNQASMKVLWVNKCGTASLLRVPRATCPTITSGTRNSVLEAPQLCALPATTTLFAEGSHHYSLVWDGDLLNRVYRMAHRLNIEPLEAMLVTRQSEWGLMPAPIVTVLIFANRKNMDDSWVQCAQLIRKYLTTQIMEPNISVEIADPRAFPWKGPDLALPMSPP
ncbi:hypothetical protein N7494_008488 [Penicillium frequentans]|uniref:Uncharacterized protein n=1 Tax=Penicillium frequentans TaxID=3151616 RepID=A0AAD6GBW2_9EURO|nr:hypothetical protein N7494_008488 [Penicillium glabrum]